MALSKSTPGSISDIEAQIAKITAELEKARAAQYASAEKVFLAAQKRAQSAQAKVDELIARAGTTVAAQNRLASARAALNEQNALLADAAGLFNAVKAEQEAADELAKNVALVLAGKKLGKKVKLNKKEKAVLKEEKKNEKKHLKRELKQIKKTAKQDAKDAKQEAKSAKKAEKLLTKKDTKKPGTLSDEHIPAEKSDTRAAEKNSITTKQPRVKKAAPVRKNVIPTPSEPNADQPGIEEPKDDVLPAPITTENVPDGTGSEPAAKETGKDVVVDSETLPPAETASEDKREKPVND